MAGRAEQGVDEQAHGGGEQAGLRRHSGDACVGHAFRNQQGSQGNALP